jgi:hypothetical protein
MAYPVQSIRWACPRECKIGIQRSMLDELNLDQSRRGAESRSKMKSVGEPSRASSVEHLRDEATSETRPYYHTPWTACTDDQHLEVHPRHSSAPGMHLTNTSIAKTSGLHEHPRIGYATWRVNPDWPRGLKPKSDVLPVR